MVSRSYYRRSSAVSSSQQTGDRHGGRQAFGTAGNSEQYSPPSRTQGRLEMKYLVVIEKGETGYGAYVPDLPGCVALAKTRARVKRLIREAIQLHIGDMRERGY